MSHYTEKMEQELREKAVWSFEDCEAYASRYPDLSTRSVVSKIKNMGLEYKPKERETKSSNPQESKNDIVDGIAQALAVSSESLSGLANANKSSLNVLRGALDILLRNSEHGDNEEPTTESC